jgi:hypothetical protein
VAQLTKKNVWQVYSALRPLIMETVQELVRGVLQDPDSALVAYPLPHGHTHERRNGEDPEAQDPVRIDTIQTLCGNRSGVTIPAFSVVYVADVAYAVGEDDNQGAAIPAIDLADNTDPAKLPPFGVTLADILNDEDGEVIRIGQIFGVDVVTPGWLNASELYLDPTTPGGLTDTPPLNPVYRIATVLANEDEGGAEEDDAGILLVDIEDVTDIVGVPSGSFLRHIEVTTDYIVAFDIDWVLADATVGGPLTVTLPDATLSDGRVIRVKKIDTGSAAANRVLIVDAGGANVEDVLSFELKKYLEIVELASDGTQWWVAG